MMVASPWQMPKWMEPFRKLLESGGTCGEGGEGVEGMMADTTHIDINGYRAIIAITCKSKVRLLQDLHNEGWL